MRSQPNSCNETNNGEHLPRQIPMIETIIAAAVLSLGTSAIGRLRKNRKFWYQREVEAKLAKQKQEERKGTK